MRSPLRWVLCVVAPALFVLPAPRAAADDEPVPGSYGWQTAAGDGLAAVLTIIGLVPASNDRQVAVVAIGGSTLYLLTAPTIHLLHGNPRGAVRSIVTRTALPTAGGLLVGLGLYALRTCGNRTGESRSSCDTSRDVVAIYGGLWAAAGGVVAASIMDATWFARTATPSASAWRVAPSIGRDQLGLMVFGTI